MPSKTTKIQIIIQTDPEEKNKASERKAGAPSSRAYPMREENLDPSLLLADPPARTPVADRRTAVTIYPDGVVYLSTNDPNVVRPIAKAISQGKESWAPLVIEGDNGRQTRWELKGDSSLISIRASKFKRPGVTKNLKKENSKDEEKKAQSAPRWDGFEF